MAETIRVEVACVAADRVFLRELTLPAGATVAEAVAASGLASAWPGVDIADDRLGVFGRRVTPRRVLRDGDRVEVYRPLAVDPKEARRRRVR
jgi:putative ubiquitin-RnfH superfamily antitoxin RatB of RatAB toxin-antitoxin module